MGKRINLNYLALILFLFFFSCNASANAKPQPIVGAWQTIDDISGKPKAIIKIEENKDHSLTGRIIKIFSYSNSNPAKICIHCEGSKKNQPLLGLIIMEHLKKSEENKDAWINGIILDPQNGKTYQCNIQLLDNGDKLAVRGFIGAPLFGRSQTWIKYRA